MAPLIDAHGLSFAYGHPTRADPVLHDVDLSIEPGTALGIVGGSGSGKSTLIRVLCGLLPATAGGVTFDGRRVDDWLDREPTTFRRANQLVFQNPASSFDPRMRIRRSLGEPVRAMEGRTLTDAELIGWLDRVGLGEEVLSRYPHQLSGGQLQRIAIARALSLTPRVLYADEPTSALDVSVQAQVLNLLMELREPGFTLVLVSHDLGVVAHVCERLIVMDGGRVVESGDAAELLTNPSSERARQLVEAARAVALR